jgi:hypothetical protein
MCNGIVGPEVTEIISDINFETSVGSGCLNTSFPIDEVAPQLAGYIKEAWSIGLAIASKKYSPPLSYHRPSYPSHDSRKFSIYYTNA